VGIALATQIIEYNRLQSQLAALDSEAEQIFRETFPRVDTINDLRYQAEEEIRRLRGEAGSGGLFPLLQATAAGTGDSGRLTMQSLQYREGRLSLNLLGEDLKALEVLRSNFNRQPAASLAVENVDADNDAVRIRATVTEAGA
jgi:type II secretory pathway component PulL